MPLNRSLRFTLLVTALLNVAFLSGAWILAKIPVFSDYILSASFTAESVSLGLTLLVALVTGWGEEIFFRGALPRLLGQKPEKWSILIYTASTAATGNLALIIAAPILAIFAHLLICHTGRLSSALILHTGFSLIVVGLTPLVVV